MKNFKNIIFDLGGVLFNISDKVTMRMLESFGIQDIAAKYNMLLASDYFKLFETGKISEAEFRKQFCAILGADISQDQLNRCWNAMIVSYPESNRNYLESLKERGYTLFVLSNTNETHVRFLEPMANWRTGLFSKIYYSNEIHLKKPDRECFEFVLADAGIDAMETVFVDDRKENADAAKAAGINAICLERIDLLEETLDNFLK